MSCTVIGCTQDHENFFWHMYESYKEVDKIKALIRWKDIYEDSDNEFGTTMAAKCNRRLAEFRARLQT